MLSAVIAEDCCDECHDGECHGAFPLFPRTPKDKTCGLYYKSFTIVIYDCNDSGQLYKTMITTISYAPNLALASSLS